MSTATLTEALTISVDYACCGHDLAADLHAQLSTGAYTDCAVLRIPETIHGWTSVHRTARRRSAHCRRLGYVGSSHIDRAKYADDIHEINLSRAERQGRPMSPSYLVRPSETPDPAYSCPRHGVHTYGVLTGHNKLVAYLWMYRAGDLALVSQILGHADHEPNDVMYELFHTAMCAEVGNGPGSVVYNTWRSGRPGLRYFKSKLGFREQRVEWAL